MPTRFDIRAVRYVVGGARAGSVTVESLGGTFPVDDPSGLDATVSEVIYGTLPAITEMALEYYDGDTDAWAEPANARFLINTDDNDDVAVAGVHQIKGVALIPYLLGKLVVEAPADPLDLLANGHRPFNSATPGAIMATLLDEGQTLGWAPYVTFDFDADDDSNGDPWPQQLSIGYKPGTLAWVVLKNLIDQGLVEFRTEGRLLRLFAAGQGVDHTVEPAPGVDFAPVRVGLSASSTPTKRSLNDLLTDANLYGDNGFTHTVNNPAAPTELGRLVAAIQQGGVNDEGTAELLIQAQLDRGSQVREQVSATEDSAIAESLPWVHYQPNDWVLGRIRDSWQRVRVPEVVVTKTGTSVTVTAVLNDRFLELLARLAKRTSGILGGAVAGGTGAVPSLPGDDLRQPKAPTDLILSSTGYWSNATPLAQVSAGWAAVTQGLDDVAIEVASYELWARLDDGADESDQQTSSVMNSASWSPYAPLEEWLFKVRAISANGIAGPFSDEEPITMAQPTAQVGTPTAPLISSNNGIVIVSWDGLIDGTPPTNPPTHFRQVNVETSGEEFGDFARIGTLFIGNQRAAFPGLGVGAVPWFRFVGVDSLGRESTPSAAVSVLVVGVDGADLVANSVEVNSLKAGSITVDYLSAGLSDQITLSAEQVVIQAGQIADLDAGLDDTSADLADLRLYVVIDGSEMRLTRPGSDNAFALDNERIAARQSGVDVSWWEAGAFNVPVLVAGSAQIGPMKFEADPDGTGLVVRRL